MLGKAPPVPDILPTPATDDTTSVEANTAPNSVTENASLDVATAPIQEPPNPENEPMMVEDVHEVQVNAAAGPLQVGFRARVSLSRRAPASQTIEQPQRPVTRAQKPSDDRLFTLAAIGLTIAISILILKKFLKSYGIFLM